MRSFSEEIEHIQNENLPIDLLLRDSTTHSNIKWMTDSYSHLGDGYQRDDYITEESLLNPDFKLLRNCERPKADKKRRTKDKAEVVTPLKIITQMNDTVENELLEGKFVDRSTWVDYISKTCLEITCGEAPFLVSRYDASAGEPVSVPDRVGILDRKLRAISKGSGVSDLTTWFELAKTAVKSVYGYDYQGDNVLMARLNVLMSIEEHVRYVFNQDFNHYYLRDLMEIIHDNIWQMDGLTDCVPKTDIPCEITDWTKHCRIPFKSLKEKS